MGHPGFPQSRPLPPKGGLIIYLYSVSPLIRLRETASAFGCRSRPVADEDGEAR
jgi:hypothetical protein